MENSSKGYTPPVILLIFIGEFLVLSQLTCTWLTFPCSNCGSESLLEGADLFRILQKLILFECRACRLGRELISAPEDTQATGGCEVVVSLQFGWAWWWRLLIPRWLRQEEHALEAFLDHPASSKFKASSSNLAVSQIKKRVRWGMGVGSRPARWRSGLRCLPPNLMT